MGYKIFAAALCLCLLLTGCRQDLPGNNSDGSISTSTPPPSTEATEAAEVPTLPTPTPLPAEYAGLEGVWQHLRGDPSNLDGFTYRWTICANGYALMEYGYGQYTREGDGLMVYYNDALFGTYTISDDVLSSNKVLTFTVTEDWIHNHGEDIGKVFTYRFSFEDGQLQIDRKLYKPAPLHLGYLHVLRDVENGITGYDRTGLENP